MSLSFRLIHQVPSLYSGNLQVLEATASVQPDAELRVRRLCFKMGLHEDLIQSETKLLVLRTGEEVFDRKLQFQFHHAMMFGFALLPEEHLQKDVLVIGLGGGTLPAMLASLLPAPWHVDVVELDSLVVQAALRYFGLGSIATECNDIAAMLRPAPIVTASAVQMEAAAAAAAVPVPVSPAPAATSSTPERRLRLLAADGLALLREAAAHGRRWGVCVVDVDAKDGSSKLEAPAAPFVDPEALRALAAVCQIAVLNVVCEDTATYGRLQAALRAVFAHCVDVSLRRLRPREELNRVLLCVPRGAGTGPPPVTSGPAALAALEARLRLWNTPADALLDRALLRDIAARCWPRAAAAGAGAAAAAAAAAASGAGESDGGGGTGERSARRTRAGSGGGRRPVRRPRLQPAAP